ncbi:hypothetical protein Sjap_011541 [Stephania japonica]|uniref:Jacalin-type lectin domain-containing protein n=1 Tax=Stephania japonica TaxID=461633 RepID=A0AAP0JBK1_9MAGN
MAEICDYKFLFTPCVILGMKGSDQKWEIVNGGTRKSIQVGPWGGGGGTNWDDGSYNGIRGITIVYDRCIDSIRIEYDKGGKPVLGEKHGGNGGNQTINIKLNYPEEFLTHVSGHYSSVVHGGGPVIRSLKLKTNQQRTFGPFGIEEGTPFSFPIEAGGFIVGFTGRSGWYLDAVGFHLSRLNSSNSLFSKVSKKLQKLLNNETNQPAKKTNHAVRA